MELERKRRERLRDENRRNAIAEPISALSRDKKNNSKNDRNNEKSSKDTKKANDQSRTKDDYLEPGEL